MSVRTYTQRPQGFTLVELLVATTIGLIILGAVAQIFASSSATYGVEQGLARLQENGRFGMEFIKQDLRMAGAGGCVNVNQTLNTNANYAVATQLTAPTFATNFVAGQHIGGFDYTGSGTAPTDWSPSLPTAPAIFSGTEAEPLEDTDVVFIRRGASPTATLAATMGVTTDPVTIDANDAGVNGLDLELNDIVIVADCNNLDIFQITGITPSGADVDLAHAGGLNGAPTLSTTYDTNATVMKLVTSVYYIGRQGNNANNPPGLFRKDMAQGIWTVLPDSAPQELVEGVESMHIVYGEDLDADGSADQYSLPAAITGTGVPDPVTGWPDMSRVASMRIGMLVRTPGDKSLDYDTRAYDVLGDAGVGPNNDDFGPANDKRQRRIFTSTVRLRNQRTD